VAVGIGRIAGRLVQRVRGWKKPGQEEAPLYRYPPVAAGIPALPVEEILRGHKDTLAKIRHLVEVEEDWFKWYLPLITRYAAFVHLLPASEAHHHRGAGGLLAHGLEVGLYTLHLAYDKLYGVNLEPAVRRYARPRWQYGCFVAGLCHDVGKPLALLRVTLEPDDRNLPSWDERCWRPLEKDLVTWCRENRAEKYWVVFRRRRAADHERLAALSWDRVITEVDRSYVSEYDPDLLLNVLATIQKESQVDHEMGKFVNAADRRSVQADLSKSNLSDDVGQNLGLPVMRILGDAILRMVRDGVWRVNVPGGRLWYMESGLYLVWPEGGKDLGILLDRDEAYRGVPRQTQVMAEILHEWNYVEPTPGGSPFWWVSLEGVTADKPLLALRIRDPRGLVEVLPAPWPGGVRPYELGRAGEPGLDHVEGEEGSQAGAQGTGQEEEAASTGVAPSGADAGAAAAEPSAGLPVPYNREDGESGRKKRAWQSLLSWMGGMRRVSEGLVPGMVRTGLLEAYLPPWESGWEGCTELARIRKLLMVMMEDIEQDMASEAAGSGEQDRQTERLLELWELAVLFRRCCEKEGLSVEDFIAKPRWVREINALLDDGVALSVEEAYQMVPAESRDRLREYFRILPDGLLYRGAGE